MELLVLRHIVNSFRSYQGCPSDPNTFELSENWPGGRTNHLLFDLNRDWFNYSSTLSQKVVLSVSRHWLQMVF